MEFLLTRGNLLLLVATEILLLGQIVLIVLGTTSKTEARARLVYRWSCVLAAVAPLVIGALVALRYHHMRTAALYTINVHAGAELAVLLGKGIQEAMTPRLLAGVGLALAGVLGFAGVLVSWLRLRRLGTAGPASIVAFAGLAGALCALGLGLGARAMYLIDGVSAISFADQAEKHWLMAHAFAEAVDWMPFTLVAIGVVAITGLTIAVMAARKRIDTAASTGWLLAAGVAVLVTGGSFFAATRSHARDADSLVALLEWVDRSGNMLLHKGGVRLPRLKNTKPLQIAPVIVATDHRIVMEGHNLGDKARILGDPDPVISWLVEKLGELKRIHEMLHPNLPFDGAITLQFDSGLSGAVVNKVLRSCHQAGYRRFQVATLQVRTFPSAVLGVYADPVYRALTFDLAGDEQTGAMEPPAGDSESFGEWARKMDDATAQGKASVRLADDQQEIQE